MSRFFQRILLALGVIALVALISAIVLSVAATTHGNTPVREVNATAGSYTLKVNFYVYPANAGYAFPFAIVPQSQQRSNLTFKVTSVPGHGVQANPVKASVSPDPKVPGGIQGSAEITVRGVWNLQVIVDGSAGQGIATIPVMAVAPTPIPLWLGWLIGLFPGGIITFLLWYWNGKKEEQRFLQTPERLRAEVDNKEV